MSEDNERSILALLAEVAYVSKVGGGPVPLPDSTGAMKDHLFVNLTLGNMAGAGDLTYLMEHLRDIAFDAFERLRQGADVRMYATICVSLFTPISDTEALRIYRTRLKTSDLPSLQRESLKKIVTGEESGERELNELLQKSKNI